MTKIRQYVSIVMAVIIMSSAFNPYSVYADEVAESTSQPETETDVDEITESESEIESESETIIASVNDEVENDGIYEDASSIDDFMIDGFAVDTYASTSRPTGDGRETSGGSLRDSGGHRVGRTGGGHTVSSSATASSSTEKFLKDIRDDIDNLGDLVDGIGLKLVAVNNNLCDAIGYLWDISMTVERVSSSVATCANWLAKSKDVLDNILSNILKGNVLISSINVDVGNINKSLTSFVTSFDFMKEHVLTDYGNKHIADRIYDMYFQLESVKTYLSLLNSNVSNALKNSSGVTLIEYVEQIFNHVYYLYSNTQKNYDNILKYLKNTLVDADSKPLAGLVSSMRNTLGVIRVGIDNLNSKLTELVDAVKNINQRVVIIDNTDRTKSDDEDENASLFDLVKMIMYSIFILSSLLDLLLLLLEYVVLMFQIPAVPALMNENVLLGWNYANAICIPGTQFSIISFLRLLMYITVIFSAIKVIKRAIDNGSIGVI